MARKSKQDPAKSQTSSKPTQPKPATELQADNQSKSLFSYNTQKAINLLVLAALYAPLSQLILAPVYGSIPSAKYHKYIITGAPLLSYILRTVLPKWVDRTLPIMAFWIPSIHFVLFGFSGKLAENGPLVTELLTTFPLITLSNYMAMKLVEDVKLPALGSSEAGPPMVVYALFTVFQRLLKDVLPSLMGIHLAFTRTGLQLFIGMLYGLILPRSLFWPAIPSVAFTLTANPHLQLHRPTEVAENTLALYNYTLLDRRESLTGYLSVIEDRNLSFRVLRCDHSLLGGQWQLPPNPIRRVNEPIYAVFTMLEAVRLIEPPWETAASSDTTNKRALNIGLGIGTAPSAFITHGINTTILELDPVVHEFATKYFDLPKNHTYYIGDAIDFVHGRANKIDSIPETAVTTDPLANKEAEALQYDYIIHDTFTGGALPIPLFTRSFLLSLAKLLNPNGAIAINYAGDLDLPSAALVYRTITSVFRHCRVFREDAAEGEGESSNNTNTNTNTKSSKVYEGDFTNLVYFCLSPQAPLLHTLKFRQAKEADYLGSMARRAYMMPRHELDVKKKFMQKRTGGDDTVEADPEFLEVGNVKSIKLVERHQAKSAFGHWKLMRTVIPPQVWETW